LEEQGIILNTKQGTFNCWFYASHTGEWIKGEDQDTMQQNNALAISSGLLAIHSSKLQTPIALSSTEAEYIALTTATREILSLPEFRKEAKSNDTPIDISDAAIHC
jgi:hypothetical protein